jgi:hypothetical protein
MNTARKFKRLNLVRINDDVYEKYNSSYNFIADTTFKITKIGNFEYGQQYYIVKTTTKRAGEITLLMPERHLTLDVVGMRKNRMKGLLKVL